MQPTEDAQESNTEKPVPRMPRSPQKSAQIQAQNRRREYLQRHPVYFQSLEHELADPILYERLIKRFQTIEEREAEGKAKGYGRTLEADLLRGEEKLANATSASGHSASALLASTLLGVESAWDKTPSSQEQGRQQWHAFLAERFVQGGDEDFDYGPVDGNEDYDTVAQREAEEAWFDDEEPSWEAVEATPPSSETRHSPRQGDTGIQDF